MAKQSKTDDVPVDDQQAAAEQVAVASFDAGERPATEAPRESMWSSGKSSSSDLR